MEVRSRVGKVRADKDKGPDRLCHFPRSKVAAAWVLLDGAGWIQASMECDV